MLTVHIHIIISANFCRLKAYNYCNDFLGRKINLTGISPAKRSRSGPNSVYVDMSRGNNVQRFCARSAHFGQNGGWDESREARVFLCGNPEDLSATSHGRFSPNLVVHCPVAESGKTFSRLFTLGIICPQNLETQVSQTGTSLRARNRSRDALQ